MRMKLVALIGAGLLLAGCSAAELSAEPSAEPSAASESTSDLDKTSNFCDVFDRQEATFREAIGESVDVFALEKLTGWATALEELAPADIAATVQTYIEPIRIVESGTDGSVDSFAWTKASNDLNMGCIGDLIDK